jgi:hypothetical protein
VWIDSIYICIMDSLYEYSQSGEINIVGTPIWLMGQDAGVSN